MIRAGRFNAAKQFTAAKRIVQSGIKTQREINLPVIGQIIADSARLGLGYSERLLKDVGPDQFARLARIGDSTIQSNHPAFIFGHLSLYACRVVQELGKEAGAITPSESYMRLFSKDATCIDDPDGTTYPPMQEIVERFFTGYQKAIETVERADDASFTRENPNEAMRGKFSTVGSMHAFYLGGHVSLHLGQLSAWRRAMGLGAA